MALFSESEITVHGCPDIMSDQIQKYSDILTLLQFMQILHYFITNDKIVKYILKPEAH